jgi:dihydroneopterin aldolase
MDDRIVLRNLRVFAHHGALEHERELGQVFVVDIDLGMDLAPAGVADDLARTVDYGKLAAAVSHAVAASPRALLEAVAEDVARLVLSDARVEDVVVRITKPHAPLPVDAEVAVEIRRARGHQGER